MQVIYSVTVIYTVSYIDITKHYRYIFIYLLTVELIIGDLIKRDDRLHLYSNIDGGK